jgi:hypothetical protein
MFPARNHWFWYVDLILIPQTGLISEVEGADMMLHVGDFAYDLDSGGGTVGDQFMQNIEQIAAYVPYMVSVGNHGIMLITLFTLL